MGVDPPELVVFLSSCDKKGKKLSKNIESFEAQVTAVHDVERSRFRNHDVKDIDIMECPLGDFDERGDAAAKVQESMHFDGGLMLAERSPDRQRSIVVESRA